MKMCAEPAPDVVLARTADFILKGTDQGAIAEAQAKLSEQLAQLGGRTEAVLMRISLALASKSHEEVSNEVREYVTRGVPKPDNAPDIISVLSRSRFAQREV